MKIRTTFLLHHDPKLNLNRLRHKPSTPEHIGQHNLNCIIQTLSLRYMPSEIKLIDANSVSIDFDRNIDLHDIETMLQDLKHCSILDNNEFIMVEPNNNLWATLC